MLRQKVGRPLEGGEQQEARRVDTAFEDEEMAPASAPPSPFSSFSPPSSAPSSPSFFSSLEPSYQSEEELLNTIPTSPPTPQPEKVTTPQASPPASSSSPPASPPASSSSPPGLLHAHSLIYANEVTKQEPPSDAGPILRKGFAVFNDFVRLAEPYVASVPPELQNSLGNFIYYYGEHPPRYWRTPFAERPVRMSATDRAAAKEQLLLKKKADRAAVTSAVCEAYWDVIAGYYGGLTTGREFLDANLEVHDVNKLRRRCAAHVNTDLATKYPIDKQYKMSLGRNNIVEIVHFTKGSKRKGAIHQLASADIIKIAKRYPDLYLMRIEAL